MHVKEIYVIFIHLFDSGMLLIIDLCKKSNAGPHVSQTFLNDVFTFLTEVGNAGRIVNTGTSSVNLEFVTALNSYVLTV
jgi:hypothetical protein